MTLPASIHVAPAQGTDEEAVLVLVLLGACQVADTGRSDRELFDVLEEWGQPGVEIERDAWIARDAGGDAIGYAFVHGGRAEVRVHPRSRLIGLGTHLRRLVEERATEQGERELLQVVAGGNRQAERLLERSGYVPVHHAWRMERPLDVEPASPKWPRGVAAQPFRGDGDAAAVLALLERSAARTPDGLPLALDRFHAEHLSDERIDPELCVLAYRRDTLVGAAISETWDDSDGTIVQLAVDPGSRNKGVGRALLLASFERLRSRGLNAAVLQLGADDAQEPSLPAIVGMRPVWRQTSWRKRLF
jgi:GNAT superfamily N-acetyltransferase